MAEPASALREYRRELLVGVISLVLAVTGLVVTKVVRDLLRDPSATLSNLSVTLQTRGDRLRQDGVRPTDAELGSLDDRGARIEVELRVRKYDELVIVCELAGPGPVSVPAQTHSWKGERVASCWFALPPGDAQRFIGSVRVFEPGDRRHPVDRIGPRALTGA